MRPEILFPLFAPITSLPGIGKGVAKPLEKLVGTAVSDLLWHLPTGMIDRRLVGTIADAPPGAVVTLLVTVDQHLPGHGRSPYRVRCRDDSGVVTLAWFAGRAEYLTRLLPPDSRRAVSGKIEMFGNERQITHPDHVVEPEALDQISGQEPVYPLAQGIRGKALGKAVAAALDRLPALPEWLRPERLAIELWPDWRGAVIAAHHPDRPDALAPTAPVRRRLAYDELLANQLALGMVRLHQRRLAGRALCGDGQLGARLTAALPFALTAAQNQAIAEILADMASNRRMLRLLQGDVGSGKTLVALMAMLTAVEAGTQAVLMAPTELLARQHLATIAPLAEAAGITVAALTGRDKGRARAAILADLAEGRAHIAVGTHALFQEDVAFHDLGLAVIDEQHRFGVHQRLSLTSKGHAVDVLVMTATPIPRTLMLTAYGDLDVSRLTGKPPGRQPVDTRVVALDRLDEVVAAVGRRLDQGDKAYWVCPLVEETELLDQTAAIDRHGHLMEQFGPRVGLIHGRMKPAEKDRVMQEFAEGGLDLLVATTVIEVGVDVPAARVMVIEHADRFGLAQLHQLRGRVGRGSGGASTCILLYQAPASAAARQRLETLRSTDDGFVIAEADLKLRGAGEVLGTRQSGMPTFRLADLETQDDLLEAAREEAALILQTDPDLTGPRSEALRVLLYLFERDAAVRYLRSG